jgi:hypothetical protein
VKSIRRRGAAPRGPLALVFALAFIPGVIGCKDPPRQEAAVDAAPPADPPTSASASAAAVPAPVAEDAGAAAVAQEEADAGPGTAPADRRGVTAGGARKIGAGRAAGAKVEAVAAPAPDPAPASTTTTTGAESSDTKRPKRAPAPMINEDPYGNAAAPGIAPSTLKKTPMRDEDPYGAAPAKK